MRTTLQQDWAKRPASAITVPLLDDLYVTLALPSMEGSRLTQIQLRHGAKLICDVEYVCDQQFVQLHPSATH